jgi:hypothetical protein
VAVAIFKDDTPGGSVTTFFYDSASPGKIPAGARACLYSDGEFVPTPAEVKRLGPVRWITVLGGASAAARAGCIDFETGNEAYVGAQLRQWALARKAMNCRARVYCNFSDSPKAHAQVSDLPNVVWWLATLDGHQMTAEQVVTRLAEFGVHVGTDRIWGQQYQGGPTAPFDVSQLLGVW